MSHFPKTIVLIPHYNNLVGLYKSVASIYHPEGIDILIIDDGSNEPPDSNIVEKNCQPNVKQKTIYLNKNTGIEKTLNIGLEFIQSKGTYKYIARLDCGDLCLKNRFIIQEEFLETNEEIYLVGTQVDFYKHEKKIFTYDVPEKHEIIKRKMFLNTMFIHPSVMFRVKALEKIGYYSFDFPAAEDYEFFFRFINNFKTANTSQVLLNYEYNDQGISLTKRNRQIRSRIKVICKNFHFGIYPIFGILRNLTILLIPSKFILSLKKYIKKKP